MISIKCELVFLLQYVSASLEDKLVSLKDCQLLLSSENITRLQRVIPKELVRRREGGNRREEEGNRREEEGAERGFEKINNLFLYFYRRAGHYCSQ